MKDWEAVAAAGLSLVGTTLGTGYGRPGVKLRGRTLASATAPSPDSFVLRVAEMGKDILLATDPGTFWQTDHYRGWPAVLVRYGTGASGRVAALLARAHWDAATARVRRDLGDRP